MSDRQASPASALPRPRGSMYVTDGARGPAQVVGDETLLVRRSDRDRFDIKTERSAARASIVRCVALDAVRPLRSSPTSVATHLHRGARA